MLHRCSRAAVFELGVRRLWCKEWRTGKVGPRTRVLAVAVHDEELSYRTWEGTEGRFRARTFAGPGGIVALLTDIPYGEDGKTMPYLTYNVERAAQCVCERF
jgi:hypothetical protein